MTPGCLGGFDHTCLVVGLLLCKLTGFSSSSAPCTPANVGLTYSCETGITFLTWDETLGRQSFYATVRSGDHELSCSTNQTDCSMPLLLCGRTYDVEVVGVADHCNSTVPGVAQMQTGKGWVPDFDFRLFISTGHKFLLLYRKRDVTNQNNIS